MDESEYEHVQVSKKGRHRKKQLYKSILQLMEFYFSDSNLAKDRFLSQLINEDPYVDLSTFLTFNKIRKLNCELEDIRKAISKSNLLELSEDRDKIKRKLPIKFNHNVDNCTVYVENIKADANHNWVSNIFAEFGNVVYVSIPKYKHNRTNKGFAFVEFENEQGAKNALAYFESIGSKMPSETSPENLKSIQTFEEETNKSENVENKEETNLIEDDNTEKNKNKDEHLSNKRKLEEEEEKNNKKIKLDDAETKKDEQNQVEEKEDTESKKKKHKKDKKKSMIKESGLQVLSKPEWKKMRNRYLDLQRKKMKEFKQYLNKQRFAQKSYDKLKRPNTDFTQLKEEIKEDPAPKLEFIPGVIVKIKLPEPVIDVKKIKNDIKALSSDVKYVDIPLPTGSEEIFIRFSNTKDAKEFCSKEFTGDKTVLQDDEEQMYWQKIQADRVVKFSKNVKKQRGRDKLLKKAEKERAKHIKFEEGE